MTDFAADRKFIMEMANNMPFMTVDNKSSLNTVQKSLSDSKMLGISLPEVGLFWENGKFVMVEADRVTTRGGKFTVKVGCNIWIGEFVEFRQLKPSEGAKHPRRFVLHSKSIYESVDVHRPSFVGWFVSDPQFVTENEASARPMPGPTQEEMAANRIEAIGEYFAGSNDTRGGGAGASI